MLWEQEDGGSNPPAPTENRQVTVLKSRIAQAPADATRGVHTRRVDVPQGGSRPTAEPGRDAQSAPLRRARGRGGARSRWKESRATVRECPGSVAQRIPPRAHAAQRRRGAHVLRRPFGQVLVPALPDGRAGALRPRTSPRANDESTGGRPIR